MTGTDAQIETTQINLILEKVARKEGVDTPELSRPLYEAVDPDALESLLESDSNVTVTFRYLGYDVTATSDGRVTVT